MANAKEELRSAANLEEVKDILKDRPSYEAERAWEEIERTSLTARQAG